MEKRKVQKLEGQPFHVVAGALTDAQLIAFYLNGVRGAIMAASDANTKAINRHSENTGKWLALVVKAIAAKGDPETLKIIAAEVAALKDARGDLADAIAKQSE